MSRINLANKNVLITGAARGLGLELTKKLHSRGAKILALDRDATGLAHLQTELKGIQILEIDLTDQTAVASLKSKVHSSFGRLDVLVNNAGIVKGGEFLKVSAEDHLKTIDVNLKSMIQITHLFLPDLLEAPDSLLLQIGSVTGLMGLAFGTSYASSKWGVLGFSESLRQELRATKTKSPHICVVCPSYIATGMFEGAGAPKLMPFLKTSDLAEKILKSAEARAYFVKSPWLVKTVPLLRASLPVKIQDLMLDWFGVAKGMRQWRGRERSEIKQ